MKIISTIYDINTHSAVVGLKDKNGKVYIGKSKMHPEDADIEGVLFGQEVAFKRAEYRALKEQWREAKAACEECRKFVASCEQSKRWDRESETAKAIYHQLNGRIKRVNKLADDVNNKQKEIMQFIKRREVVLGAIERKKTIKDETN